MISSLNQDPSSRYPLTHVAGNGQKAATVAFPESVGDARTVPLGDVLALTADMRDVRNATQDVYLTERVRNDWEQ